MKKNLLKCFAALAVVAIVLPSCKKNVNCVGTALDISSAASVYSGDDSEANCIAYRDALQVGIDDCSDSSAAYTTSRDALPCL